MWISARQLYREDKRLPNWQVLESRGVCGFLVLGYDDVRCWRSARLVDAQGKDLLQRLTHAKIEQSKGPDGMLVEGVHLVGHSSKHSRPLRQAWWCHAPPRALPLRDMSEYKRRHALAGFLEDDDLDDGLPLYYPAPE